MNTHVHSNTVYNSKDLEPTQTPIDNRPDKENVAHIHHGILCSHKKNDEFKSFVGTWKNLETIILSKLTQEKIKHCMFSLIGECWAMGTHGPGKGSITHWNLLVGGKGGTVWGVGRLGRDNMGRNARNRWQGDGGSKSHCHVCNSATILHVLHMYPET